MFGPALYLGIKFETHHFENHFKHDQKFDFDQTLSIREVDAPKKIQWDSKNRRIYWLNQDGKIYSSLENGDNLTELDLDGDYARGFDIYSQGSTNHWCPVPGHVPRFPTVH